MYIMSIRNIALSCLKWRFSLFRSISTQQRKVLSTLPLVVWSMLIVAPLLNTRVKLRCSLINMILFRISDFFLLFSTISRFLERIRIKHIKQICSWDSKLSFLYICFVGIPSRNRDIFLGFAIDLVFCVSLSTFYLIFFAFLRIQLTY